MTSTLAHFPTPTATTLADRAEARRDAYADVPPGATQRLANMAVAVRRLDTAFFGSFATHAGLAGADALLARIEAEAKALRSILSGGDHKSSALRPAIVGPGRNK